MISDYTGMRYKEILTEGAGKEGIDFIDGEIMLLGKTVMALNFNDDFMEKFKSMEFADDAGQSAVIVCQILPADVIENFKENLTELIKYIIFDDQRYVHKLNVIAEDDGIFADATAAVQENKTMISSTQTEFPIERNTLFHNRLEDFSGSIMINENEYYWFEIEYQLIPDNLEKAEFVTSQNPETEFTDDELLEAIPTMPLFPNKNPPEDWEMTNLPEINKTVTEVYDIHKFIFHIQRIFTKSMANLCTSISRDKFDVSVFFNIMTKQYKGWQEEQGEA